MSAGQTSIAHSAAWLTPPLFLVFLMMTLLHGASSFAPGNSYDFAIRPAEIISRRISDASCSSSSSSRHPPTAYFMAQVSQQEAQVGINRVVAALRKDKAAQSELGKLEKVTTVLGFGSPSPGTLAVRFNASFRKSGMGRSSVPLPFGLGQSNKPEGRGTMVGQVKASIKDGKIASCSVFRDLGYGRSFELRL